MIYLKFLYEYMSTLAAVKLERKKKIGVGGPCEVKRN
jgi:hypothetical protein